MESYFKSAEVKQFKVVLLTGSRQVGKSTMMKEKFLPSIEYLNERSLHVKKYENLWNHIQRGCMPELYDENIEWESFYRSFVRTYFDSDVSALPLEYL